MLILDYDSNVTYDSLLKILTPFLKDACFAIYKTYAGFHVHLLSKQCPHEDDFSYDLMKSLKCDPFYALFSHKFGFKVRLSRKIGRNEEYILRFISLVGNPQLVDPKLYSLLQLHDFYVQQGNNSI
jgi:hypothetical protein